MITGASGHVGSTLVNQLLSDGCNVRVFVLPQERQLVPEQCEIYTGDVTDKESLKPFFKRDDYDELILIHVAGIVSLSSDDNPLVWKVNYEGTRNLLDLSMEYKAERFIYVTGQDEEVYRSPHWLEPLSDEELEERREAYLQRGLDVDGRRMKKLEVRGEKLEGSLNT